MYACALEAGDDAGASLDGLKDFEWDSLTLKDGSYIVRYL